MIAESPRPPNKKFATGFTGEDVVATPPSRFSRRLGSQLYDSAMTQEAPRRNIRLFPDYGHRWPLWENSTPEHPTKYTMEPADFGLSEHLTQRLRAWYDTWDAENLHQSGWSSPEHETAWRTDGANIAEELRAEVRAFADVEYNE